eukprot:COSAG02_NODE_33361_length_501_cov_0.791045_1_plen_47_part_10
MSSRFQAMCGLQWEALVLAPAMKPQGALIVALALVSAPFPFPVPVPT